MKKLIKLLVGTWVMCLTMIACDELNSNEELSPEKPFVAIPVVDPSAEDSLKLGGESISPLRGSLTAFPNENFVYNERTFYCFLLKLETFYPGKVIFPHGSEGTLSLSYSINFKLFTELKDGPVNESWSVEMPADIVSYYQAMDQGYAVDHKTFAFLYGDRSFDPNLDANEYINYLKSQIRIKSGTLQITKLLDNYLISFEGHTETDEEVSFKFNGVLSHSVDNQFESRESDFSTTEIPENYILKDRKYYKLEQGTYYVLAPFTYQGKPIQTVKLFNRREYYRYEYNYYYDKAYAGLINQHWKSNALVLQFQFDSFYYFKSKTYQVAPSKGIHSVGYYLSDHHDVPFEGFPNDSLFIGYYHVGLDTPFTFTYDEDPHYMENQMALQSGQLKVTEIDSGYEFQGDFIDARGDEVKVKFKASRATDELVW